MHKKTKILLASSACAAICLCAAFTVKALGKKPEAQNQSVREYTVTRGDITVGVEGAGQAAVDKLPQNAPANGKLEEIRVKQGQSVKKGDVLATLSEEDLREKLAHAEEAYQKGLIALEQAKLAKRQSDIGAQTTFDDLANRISNTKNEYQAASARQNEAIAALQTQIDALAAEIAALRAQLDVALEGDKAALQAQIAQNEKQHAELCAKRDALQEELRALTKTYSETEDAWQNDAKHAGEKKDIALRTGDLSLQVAQMDFANLKKARDDAKKALEQRDIYAEQDGIVLSIEGKVGTELAKGMPLLTLGNMGGRTVQVLVPQTEIFKIQAEQTVELWFEAHPDAPVYGKVESIGYVPETANGAVNYRVTIRLPDTELAIYEGMTAEATFILKQKKDVLMLSNKAIRFQDGKQYVQKRTPDGDFVETEVETGFSDGKVTEITAGLAEGDIVAAIAKSAAGNTQSGTGPTQQTTVIVR